MRQSQGALVSDGDSDAVVWGAPEVPGRVSVLQVHGPHLGQRGCGERLANKYPCGKEAPRPWHSAGVTDGRRARPLVLGRGQEAGELPRSGPLGSSRAKRIYQAEEWERDSVGGSNTDVDVGRCMRGVLGRSGDGKDGKRGCRTLAWASLSLGAQRRSQHGVASLSTGVTCRA